jgi:hypothetical protein
MGKECASIKTTATGAEQTKTHKINPIQPGPEIIKIAGRQKREKEGNSVFPQIKNKKPHIFCLFPISYNQSFFCSLDQQQRTTLYNQQWPNL